MNSAIAFIRATILNRDASLCVRLTIYVRTWEVIMNNFIRASVGILLAASTLQNVSAQERDPAKTYSKETTSTDDNSQKSGDISAKDTSREKLLYWNPITVPSGNGFAFSQRVSNLVVSIIEQKSGAGKITTLYAASGTFFNKSEDDLHNGALTWTIRFRNSAGTVIDSFQFTLPWNHCSYHGEEPFNIPPRPTSFNLIDVIVDATATGYKPGGYEGGC